MMMLDLRLPPPDDDKVMLFQTGEVVSRPKAQGNEVTWDTYSGRIGTYINWPTYACQTGGDIVYARIAELLAAR